MMNGIAFGQAVAAQLKLGSVSAVAAGQIEIQLLIPGKIISGQIHVNLCGFRVSGDFRQFTPGACRLHRCQRRVHFPVVRVEVLPQDAVGGVPLV